MYLSIFSLFPLFFFMFQITFFYHFHCFKNFFFFGHSFRLGLLSIYSLSFPSPENVLISSFIPEGHFSWIENSRLTGFFLLGLKMLFHFCGFWQYYSFWWEICYHLICCFLIIKISFLSCCFEIFFFVFLTKFDYVSCCRFIWVFPVWDSSSWICRVLAFAKLGQFSVIIF